MKARTRTLALAAALAALLAAVVAGALLLVERPDQAARARHDRETRALPFQPGEVAALSIAPRGAPGVRLVRDGAGWLLPPPGGRVEHHRRGGAPRAALRDAGAQRHPRRAGRARLARARPAGGPPDPHCSGTVRELSLDLGDENPFDRTRFGRRDGEILAIEGVPDAALDPAPERLLAPPAGG